VVAMALEQPAWGQLRAANDLAQRGIPISAAGGRGVGERHELENLHKRLRALEAQVARERHLLTEAQLAALEQAKVEKEAQGELESECPG
jgi:phage terminase Nu1 subunit (DNA packaging protein)